MKAEGELQAELKIDESTPYADVMNKQRWEN